MLNPFGPVRTVWKSKFGAKPGGDLLQHNSGWAMTQATDGTGMIGLVQHWERKMKQLGPPVERLARRVQLYFKVTADDRSQISDILISTDMDVL